MRSKSTQIKLNILGRLISLGFNFQIPLTKFTHINKPDTSKSFIAVMWHAHQCSLYGFKEVMNRVNILISPSNDGQIITDACERLGYKVIRGSKGREGASKAVLKMVDALNENDIVAITVDGPRGPNHVVKKGAIELAKLSGKPIVPMVWYSPKKNFLKFNSWDEFRVPIGYSRIVNLYGDPIYVNKDITDEEFEQKRLEVQNKLEELYADLVKNYDRYVNAK
ncbi:lysophospholipid acyltransferase family protein [bacterium]|nr:lysophospholipid acyltransferase family protein [bacterium]